MSFNKWYDYTEKGKDFCIGWITIIISIPFLLIGWLITKLENYAEKMDGGSE